MLLGLGFVLMMVLVLDCLVLWRFGILIVLLITKFLFDVVVGVKFASGLVGLSGLLVFVLSWNFGFVGFPGLLGFGF